MFRQSRIKPSAEPAEGGLCSLTDHTTSILTTTSRRAAAATNRRGLQPTAFVARLLITLVTPGCIKHAVLMQLPLKAPKGVIY